MRKSKRLARGWFSILAACAAVSTSFGCSWDSSVYDAAAKNHGYVVACAPTVVGTGDDAYILINGYKCFKEDSGHSDELDVCVPDDDLCYKDCKRYRKIWDDLEQGGEDNYVTKLCPKGTNDGECQTICKDGVCSSNITEDMIKKLQSFFNDDEKDNISKIPELIYSENGSESLRVCPAQYPHCGFEKKDEIVQFSCLKKCSFEICSNCNEEGVCTTVCADLQNDASKSLFSILI